MYRGVSYLVEHHVSDEYSVPTVKLVARQVEMEDLQRLIDKRKGNGLMDGWKD